MPPAAPVTRARISRPCSIAISGFSHSTRSCSTEVSATRFPVRFPHLFRPGQIGSMEVRNRLIASPMERNYCTLEGRATQVYIDYLEARARGGVGLMYTEATYVDPRGKGRGLQMGLYDDDLIAPVAQDGARSAQAWRAHRARAELRRPRGAPRGQRFRVLGTVGGALRGRRAVRAARDDHRRHPPRRAVLRRRGAARGRGGLRLRRHPRRTRLPDQPVLLAVRQQAR